jgi:hypothetical protein
MSRQVWTSVRFVSYNVKDAAYRCGKHLEQARSGVEQRLVAWRDAACSGGSGQELHTKRRHASPGYSLYSQHKPADKWQSAQQLQQWIRLPLRERQQCGSVAIEEVD